MGFGIIQLVNLPMLTSAGGGAPVELNLTITANADDGNDGNGTWNGNSATALIGVVIGTGDGGFRFTGVNIPSGAIIDSADFQVEVITVVGGGAAAIIQGQDVNNAAAWNGVGPATMAVTTANITRTLGTVQRESFDVKAILQEMVDGNGGIGENLAIGVLDNGSGAFEYSHIEALEHAGNNPATIDIVWSTA